MGDARSVGSVVWLLVPGATCALGGRAMTGGMNGFRSKGLSSLPCAWAPAGRSAARSTVLTVHIAYLGRLMAPPGKDRDSPTTTSHFWGVLRELGLASGRRRIGKPACGPDDHQINEAERREEDHRQRPQIRAVCQGEQRVCDGGHDGDERQESGGAPAAIPTPGEPDLQDEIARHG